MILLRLASILLLVAGMVAMAFGFAIRDAVFGQTAVISGTVGFGGGVILFALTQTVRELRRIGELLDFQSLAVPARAGLSAVAASNGHGNTRGEGRPIELARNAKPPREMVRRRDPERLPLEADLAPRPDTRRDVKSDANGSAAPEFKATRQVASDGDETSNSHDSNEAWPSTVVMPRLDDLRRARAARAAARAEEKAAAVVTSGHVNDMSYSLYSDGSIVATTPAGVMRFSTLDEMSEYLNGLVAGEGSAGDGSASEGSAGGVAPLDSASPGAIARAEGAAAMPRRAAPRANAV